MAPTHRSSPAAVTPAGDGSGGGGIGGRDHGRGRSKRPLASPSASTSPHKRRKPPRAWARMLSQNPQTPHIPIHDDEISVGSGENCHICLDVGGDLCLLRQLMRGGPCELEVIGQTDCVVVNGTHINQFDQIILRGGDEVIFGQSGKHAYIFQHPLQDNKVTKAVLISADNSATLSDPNPSDIIPMSGWQAFKDGLKQGILSPDDIKVTSGDHPYYVSASPVIIVKAPGLQVLITGVTPAPGTAAKVIIDLRSVEALQTLQRLGLHHHVVQISSKTTVKFNGQHVYSLPSLETLDVGIQVCVPQQALELMGLLGSLPRLRELTLWRVDDLPPHGEGDDDQVWREALVPPCTAQSLEHLVLRQYRGGAAEVALVRRVLSAATRLVSVKLHPHPTVPRKGVATPFRTCPAANRVVVEKHEKT